MTEMSQDGAVVCVTLLFAGRYQRRWSVMPVGDEVPFLAAGRPSRAGQQLPAMRKPTSSRYGRLLATRNPMMRSRKSEGFRSRVAERSSHAG